MIFTNFLQYGISMETTKDQLTNLFACLGWASVECYWKQQLLEAASSMTFSNFQQNGISMEKTNDQLTYLFA